MARKKKESKDWQPYKCGDINITHTHTQTHTEMWAPRGVSDTDAARLIRILSHSLTCSLVLEKKPDSCDVAARFCLAVVTVFGAKGPRVLDFWV